MGANPLQSITTHHSHSNLGIVWQLQYIYHGFGPWGENLEETPRSGNCMETPLMQRQHANSTHRAEQGAQTLLPLLLLFILFILSLLLLLSSGQCQLLVAILAALFYNAQSFVSVFRLPNGTPSSNNDLQIKNIKTRRNPFNY